MPLCHCQPAERPAGQLIGPRVCCLPRKNEALIERLAVPAEGSEPLHFDSEYSQGYLSQFTMCLWKCAPAAPTHPGGVGGGEVFPVSFLCSAGLPAPLHSFEHGKL